MKNTFQNLAYYLEMLPAHPPDLINTVIRDLAVIRGFNAAIQYTAQSQFLCRLVLWT